MGCVALSAETAVTNIRDTVSLTGAPHTAPQRCAAPAHLGVDPEHVRVLPDVLHELLQVPLVPEAAERVMDRVRVI